MSNFEIVDIGYIKNNNMKLVIDEHINVTLSDDKNNSLQASLLELSLDKVTLVLPTSQLVDIWKNWIAISISKLFHQPFTIVEICKMNHYQ